MKPLPEAAEFAALREKHEHEWPADVKEAAARFAANLTAAHTKSFQSSPVMVNGMAEDWADFQAKLAAWRSSRA